MPDASEFARIPLPKRFCNIERLWHALEVRGLDGIVACQPHNVFYLTGFNPIAHKADEPRPYAVLLSRHAPEHPILVVADYYLARSEEHTSELQSLMRISYAVFCLKNKQQRTH